MNFTEYLKLRSKAFSLIRKKSGDEMRYSPPIKNLPYWSHLMNVHNFLVIKGEKDYETLLAALLHDIVEDTAITVVEIERMFGVNVAKIVGLVTKTTPFDVKHFYKSIRENKSAMKIKVADRIDNMLTDYVYSIGQERVKDRLDETYTYFLPFAKELSWEKDLLNACNYFKRHLKTSE